MRFSSFNLSLTSNWTDKNRHVCNGRQLSADVMTVGICVQFTWLCPCFCTVCNCLDFWQLSWHLQLSDGLCCIGPCFSLLCPGTPVRSASRAWSGWRRTWRTPSWWQSMCCTWSRTSVSPSGPTARSGRSATSPSFTTWPWRSSSSPGRSAWTSPSVAEAPHLTSCSRLVLSVIHSVYTI